MCPCRLACRCDGLVASWLASIALALLIQWLLLDPALIAVYAWLSKQHWFQNYGLPQRRQRVAKDELMQGMLASPWLDESPRSQSESELAVTTEQTASPAKASPQVAPLSASHLLQEQLTGSPGRLRSLSAESSISSSPGRLRSTSASSSSSSPNVREALRI